MNYRPVAFLSSLLLVSSVSAQDTVHVLAGWNIIGSIGAGAIPEVLSTDPPGLITTDFYAYNPGAGYQPADTLQKGQGYWVKASADGIVVFTSSGADGCGTETILHAGATYGTVKIGDQCWLDRNLDAGTMTAGSEFQYNDSLIEKYCYNDDTLNCASYGGLYQWLEAMEYGTSPGARGICPAGWHIPTSAEFTALSTAVGSDGNALKELGQGSGAGAGTNTSGFGALLAGLRWADGSFQALAGYTVLMSSTEFDFFNVFFLSVNSTNGGIESALPDYGWKGNGMSVRCLKD